MRDLDLAGITLILQESPEAALWAEASLQESCKQGEATVAEVDGGLGGLLIWRIAADEMEILNLAVARSFRRCGVGSQLVKFALKRAINRGVHHIHLELRASNGIGLTFYSGLGFQENGRRLNYYRNPVEDAILMVLHTADEIS